VLGWIPSLNLCFLHHFPFQKTCLKGTTWVRIPTCFWPKEWWHQVTLGFPFHCSNRFLTASHECVHFKTHIQSFIIVCFHFAFPLLRSPMKKFFKTARKWH
jgi:hypothetical protein